MRKQFDIKYRPQIESGEYKVIDQFGYVLTLRDVINHAWYFSLRYPNTDYETERIYDHPENHLFIVTPEEELSEFEKELSRCLCDSNVRPEEEDYDKWAKEYAPALLALARKELCEQVVDHTKEAYENGKAEALKDLPRWRKWGNGACGNSDGHPIALVAGCGGIRFVSCLGTTGEKYIFLSDLKKLPGFKED